MSEAPLIRLIQGTMQRLTGRRYDIVLERLDVKSLTELQRFLKDVEYETTSRVNNARMMPWRRP